MPRDPRVEKLHRLRAERSTRAAGPYYSTRATPYGNVQSGPRKREAGRTLLSLVVFAAIVGLVLYVGSQFLLGYRATAAGGAHTVTIVVTPGESKGAVAQELQDKKLIWNATIFTLYLELSNTNILAGPHTLHTGMTMTEVAQALSVGPPPIPTVQLTIADGWRAEEVATALDQAGVASYADMMREVERGSYPSYRFLDDRPPGATLEGYLMPDTYLFRKGGGAHYALNRILDSFDKRVSARLQAQGKTRYGSFYKALIMASIVQREAGTNHDRGLVASVYLNRLNDRSGAFRFLGADPTVQYALGRPGNWWPQITQGDIDRTARNRFNTYHNPGLPPLPISNPNLDSITAAVNPPATLYFYFWHKPGSLGKSIFCSAKQGPQCAGTPQ